MDEISSFRGMAGEVVRSFIRPTIFLTAVPILAFWGLMTLLMLFVGKYLIAPIQWVAMLAGASFLMARFALPASRGELHSGFFNRDADFSESLHFAGRYAILTLLWLVPVVLIGMLTFRNLSQAIFMSFGRLAGPDLVRYGFHGLVFLFLFIISLFAPTICAILATYTESYAELFSAEPFQWLFQERRSDLIPFYASIVGGLCVFLGLYLLPLMIVAILAFKASVGFGITVSGLIYILPVAISPILLGRLSGAFVAGEEEFGFSADDSDAPAPNHALSGVSESPSIVTPSRSIDEIHNDVNAQSEADLVANARCLDIQQNFDSFDPIYEKCCVMQKLGRTESAIKAATTAMQLALRENLMSEVVVVYQQFAKQRDNLSLSADEFEKLSNVLARHELYSAAVWCLYHVMQMLQDTENPAKQKQILGLADSASKSGKTQQAFTLYVFFIKHFPQSTLVEHASLAAKAENEKLK